MKSKEEFKRSEWHVYLVGLATLGRILDEHGGDLKKAQAHANVGEEMYRLMDKMYDYLAREEEAKPLNGAKSPLAERSKSSS